MVEEADIPGTIIVGMLLTGVKIWAMAGGAVPVEKADFPGEIIVGLLSIGVEVWGLDGDVPVRDNR